MILRNAMMTPDGTILESHNRHDCKEHTDANGEYYMVDGGLSYFRREANGLFSFSRVCEGCEDLSLTTDNTHEEIREGFSWGSYGVNGDEPLHYIFLKDMDTDHIKAIIMTQSHISAELRKVFREELIYRVWLKGDVGGREYLLSVGESI